MLLCLSKPDWSPLLEEQSLRHEDLTTFKIRFSWISCEIWNQLMDQHIKWKIPARQIVRFLRDYLFLDASFCHICLTNETSLHVWEDLFWLKNLFLLIILRLFFVVAFYFIFLRLYYHFIHIVRSFFDLLKMVTKLAREILLRLDIALLLLSHYLLYDRLPVYQR